MSTITKPARTSRFLWICIGALALFATACSTETTLVNSEEAEASSAQDDTQGETDTDEPAAEEPTATPAEPTAVPAEPTEPAAEPTPESDEPESDEPEPDAEPTPKTVDLEDLDDLGARIFTKTTFADDLTPEQLACAVGELGDNTELLTRASEAADVSDLSLDDQADLAIIAFDCAPEAIAAEFSQAFTSSEVTIPPVVGECLIERMSAGAPNRRLVILGFAALGNEVAVPIDAQTPVVDTMVDCLPGDVFSTAIADAALQDPALEGALDFDCLSGTLSGETMRPMWQAMVENPGAEFEDLSPESTGPLLDAIFACISFGEILAAQSGLALDDATIKCIDDALQDLDIAALVNDNAGVEEVGLAMLACLSPEQLAELGG